MPKGCMGSNPIPRTTMLKRANPDFGFSLGSEVTSGFGEDFAAVGVFACLVLLDLFNEVAGFFDVLASCVTCSF